MNPNELLSPDIIRLTFVVGMVLSVFLYERSHLTTGSIVVPGFLGLHILAPSIIGYSLFNAWLCFVVVHKIAPRFILMKNKSKFHLLVVTSVFLQLLWNTLQTLQMPLAIFGDQMAGLGFVIPGLIAHDMNRNGCIKTSLNTMFVTLIVGAIVIASLHWLPQLSLNLQQFQQLPFRFDLGLVLVLGTIGSILLKVKTPIRSGGYVTAAYLVFFGTQPTALLAILASALLAYIIGYYLVIPHMIIFGRRKFAVMLIVGALTSWGATMILDALGIGSNLFQHPAYAGIMILLPGLIANDMQRTSVSKVLAGMGLLASWIFILANLYYEFRYFSRPEYIFPLAGCLCGIGMLVLVMKNKPANLNSSPWIAEPAL